MVVIPALYPRVAVRWTGFFGSSLGNAAYMLASSKQVAIYNCEYMRKEGLDLLMLTYT
jgi:hypothetical protein